MTPPPKYPLLVAGPLLLCLSLGSGIASAGKEPPAKDPEAEGEHRRHHPPTRGSIPAPGHTIPGCSSSCPASSDRSTAPATIPTTRTSARPISFSSAWCPPITPTVLMRPPATTVRAHGRSATPSPPSRNPSRTGNASATFSGSGASSSTTTSTLSGGEQTRPESMQRSPSQPVIPSSTPLATGTMTIEAHRSGYHRSVRRA